MLFCWIHIYTPNLRHYFPSAHFLPYKSIELWCDHSPYLASSNNAKDFLPTLDKGSGENLWLGCLLEIRPRARDHTATVGRKVAGVRRTPGGECQSLRQPMFLSYKSEKPTIYIFNLPLVMAWESKPFWQHDSILSFREWAGASSTDLSLALAILWVKGVNKATSFQLHSGWFSVSISLPPLLVLSHWYWQIIPI